MKLGTNLDDLQKKNRCLTLSTIMEYEEISRIDLSRITQLNKATITNIINDFLDLGIVSDVGSISASNGRKVSGISLCMADVVVIVLRIKAESFRIAICGFDGQISELKIVNYIDDTDVRLILEQLVKEISTFFDYCKTKKMKLLGISIATLGWLYHKDRKYYIRADGSEELGNIDFKEALQREFPKVVFWIDHDANMSALAEWQYYCRNHETVPSSMLSIVGGVGFGGGIIIKGEVFSGYNGIAGEIGHMGINTLSQFRLKGIKNNFGGIFEDYASPLALRKSIMENFMDYPDTKLNQNSTLKEIYQAYEEDDSLSLWAVNRVARYLAYGLTSLIFILNPEVIVLGDEIIRSEKFSKQLHKYLKKYLPEELFESLNIIFSKYNENSVLNGSGLAIIKHYLRTYKIIDFINENYRNSNDIS